MRSIAPLEFEKQQRSLRSTLLASYNERTLATLKRLRIEAHLHMCELCAAEAQLLSKSPPAAHVN